MHCALYDAGRCRSCQWLELPPEQQLADKMADLRALLADAPVAEWCAPVCGPESGFRNKAKMVVSGSVERPLLGMLHRDGAPEDLTDCPLYPASFAAVFAVLKPFIARAGLTPYHVARRRGELKYLLLTESQLDGGMMLRFVLRSETKLAQLRKEQAALMGFENYASWKIADQMAQTPSAAQAFLDSLVPAATARAAQELADIQQEIDRQQGGFTAQAWDWPFYGMQAGRGMRSSWWRPVLLSYWSCCSNPFCCAVR